MERSHLDDLWTRFLAGESMSRAEQQDLFEAASRDPALVAEFLADQGFNAVLRQSGRREQDVARFLQECTLLIKAEKGGEKFVATFRERLGGKSQWQPKEESAPVHVGAKIGTKIGAKIRLHPWAWAAGLLAAGAATAFFLGPGADVLRQRGREVETGSVTADRSPPFASVLESIGEVAGRRNNEVLVLRQDVELRPGDRIETGAASSATLRYAETATLRLNAEVLLTFPATDDDSRAVRVDKGELVVEAATLPQAGPLTFATPHARAVVVGLDSRLSLAVTGGQTRLQVERGRVLFVETRDGTTRELSTAQSALATTAVESPAVVRAGVKTIPQTPASITLLQLDFEDGLRPATLVDGRVVQGPERPGSRYCVTGTRLQLGGSLIGVRLANLPLRYSETLVVTFDYWIGAGSRGLGVRLVNRDQKQLYQLLLRKVVRESWAHAEMRVSDFGPVAASDLRMESGDRLDRVLIIVDGAASDQSLFIDNLKVVE